MSFELSILGANSALPAHGRFPAAQVLSHGERLFLIDCGEGTQMRLSETGIRRNRISHIFISHLHGDHVYGLPGLISSYNHFGRTAPLHIFGPQGIKEFLEHIFRLSEVHLLYPLTVTEIGEDEAFPILLEEDGLRVRSFRLIHRVPSRGYLFEYEQALYNVSIEALAKFRLSVEEIRDAKAGNPVFRDGLPLPQEELVLPKPPRVRYAYCSDTIRTSRIVPYIQGVDLLYHEATFREDLSEKASDTKHSTARDAALIAREAGVKKLLIGHFSSRYKYLEGHLNEAGEVFPNVELAVEGKTLAIPERNVDAD